MGQPNDSVGVQLNLKTWNYAHSGPFESIKSAVQKITLHPGTTSCKNALTKLTATAREEKQKICKTFRNLLL